MHKSVKIVADNIKALREYKGLSQEKLANLCGHNTASARSWIAKIEAGERNIVIGELINIAEALEVEPATLYLDINDLHIERENYNISATIERLLKYNQFLKDMDYLKKTNEERVYKDERYYNQDGTLKRFG